eukprot:3748448-Rhodomonas_salina.1
MLPLVVPKQRTVVAMQAGRVRGVSRALSVRRGTGALVAMRLNSVRGTAARRRVAPAKGSASVLTGIRVRAGVLVCRVQRT